MWSIRWGGLLPFRRVARAETSCEFGRPRHSFGEPAWLHIHAGRWPLAWLASAVVAPSSLWSGGRHRHWILLHVALCQPKLSGDHGRFSMPTRLRACRSGWLQPQPLVDGPRCASRQGTIRGLGSRLGLYGCAQLGRGDDATGNRTIQTTSREAVSSIMAPMTFHPKNTRPSSPGVTSR